MGVHRRVRTAAGFAGGALLVTALAAPLLERPAGRRTTGATTPQAAASRFLRMPSPPDAPERYQLLVVAGNASMDAGDHTEAIESYERALTIENDARVWSDLGTCYRYVRRPDDAVAAFDRALQLDPRLWEAAFNRGSCQGSDPNLTRIWLARSL